MERMESYPIIIPTKTPSKALRNLEPPCGHFLLDRLPIQAYFRSIQER